MAWRRVTIAPLCHSLFNSESVVKIICRVQGEGDPQHSIKNIFQNLVLILRFWVPLKMVGNNGVGGRVASGGWSSSVWWRNKSVSSWQLM